MRWADPKLTHEDSISIIRIYVPETSRPQTRVAIIGVGNRASSQVLGTILKHTQTDVVVSYLPVGFELATQWYVEQVLDTGCIPVFVAFQL